MKHTHRRLQALEEGKQNSRGLRIFQQSPDDPTLYFEGIDNHQSEPFTHAAIEVFGQDGWQCIVVTYEAA